MIPENGKYRCLVLDFKEHESKEKCFVWTLQIFDGEYAGAEIHKFSSTKSEAARNFLMKELESITGKPKGNPIGKRVIATVEENSSGFKSIFVAPDEENLSQNNTEPSTNLFSGSDDAPTPKESLGWEVMMGRVIEQLVHLERMIDQMNENLVQYYKGDDNHEN
jgi:hypothetical protein